MSLIFRLMIFYLIDSLVNYRWRLIGLVWFDLGDVFGGIGEVGFLVGSGIFRTLG